MSTVCVCLCVCLAVKILADLPDVADSVIFHDVHRPTPTNGTVSHVGVSTHMAYVLRERPERHLQPINHPITAKPDHHPIPPTFTMAGLQERRSNLHSVECHSSEL